MKLKSQITLTLDKFPLKVSVLLFPHQCDVNRWDLYSLEQKLHRGDPSNEMRWINK